MNDVDPRPCETVGIVGAGRMGGAIGRQLLQHGISVLIADPNTDAQQAMAQHGATIAESAGDLAAGSDLIFLVVVNDDQVKAVMTGEGGILEHARAGTTVAICASVSPSTCVEMAEIGAQHGIHVVDMAMVGGERAAETGTIKLMCGGAEDIIANCQSVLSAFATNVCLIGPTGSGQVAKTVNNLMLLACVRIDYEALRLAKAYGVEPGRLRPAMAVGSGANRAFEEWGLHRMRFPAKDLSIAKGIADEVDVDMPLVDALLPLMEGLDAEELDRYR